jgi:hypothetical protein
VILVAAGGRLLAQLSGAPAASPASTAGSRLIRFKGRALDSEGKPLAGVAGVTFAIYEEQSGGAPLWQETKNLATDASGQFEALLGAESAAGIPAELFMGEAPRWLAVLVHAPGTTEQPRILLVSVPYAMQAANAERLGGLPASAFLRTDATCGESSTFINGNRVSSAAGRIAGAAISANGANTGYLPVFSDGAGDISNSSFFQAANGYVGIGTTTPAFNLNVISQSDPAAVTVEGYGTVGVNFIGRRARGTLAAPTALGVNDNIMAMQGRGYGATGFSPGSRAYMKFFAAENWSDTAQGTYITLATTQIGTAPTNTPAPERMRVTDAGYVGIGTTAPDQMLTVAGAIHSTAGGIVFPDGSKQLSAATGTALQAGGNLVLAAGSSSGTAGNVDMQTVDGQTSTMSDRLLIAGTPKAMTGAVPMANVFSVHIAAGDAAGGKVKFTIVASDGTNYAMETGEMVYLASPVQMSCAVVLSEYAVAPPTYTNTVMGIPAIGQSGSLNAQCMTTTFGGDPGVIIFDTAPTSFTPTTHKLYYTIENQSQSALTLRP